MSHPNLELSDTSGRPKLGLKGPGAAAWLTAHHVKLPEATFDALPLGSCGWTVRLGATEFLLEDGREGGIVSSLRAILDPLPPGVYQVPREDAAFQLAGSQAHLVFAQTCGIDFRNVVPRRVIYSRVAGVSCGILSESAGDTIRYRIWHDPSHGGYLWGTLAGIVGELGGTVQPSTRAPLAAH